MEVNLGGVGYASSLLLFTYSATSRIARHPRRMTVYLGLTYILYPGGSSHETQGECTLEQVW